MDQSARQAALKGEIYSFSMINKVDNSLIGCVSLRVSKSDNEAELGYWVGHPFWGQGFATEAAQAVVDFGFEELNLRRIFAAAMTKNPTSSNVMSKIGMKFEKNLPKHILKSGVYEDLVLYGMERF